MIDDIRPVTWHDGAVRIIDQTALPARLTYVDLTSVDELIAAIRRLAVRGAPALGVAGAYGVALALLRDDHDQIRDRIAALRAARPTAVNLAAGVDRAAARIDEGFDAVLEEAHAVLDEDLAANRTLSALGADWLLARLEDSGASTRRPLRLLTHCNAGALATAGCGTALGVVRELHARGLVEVVYVDETRPLLQGSRLTAWELARLGIPHLVQADSAAASTIVTGHVDAAIVGADRVAANGDTANKIGTLGVALACAHAGVPFLVAAPTSTVDLRTASGADIHVELRDEAEVLGRAAPRESRAHNPAFDVTPAALVSALTTERGVAEIASGELPGSLWKP
ncbi:S-methyl-5-thioribose-1-phosphate isomerase [Actinospica sp.]|uniref:S-methyl-5-thioribose-1-phosphate isomerase n=1 Tax=Actinospica sp. TaxID=1872142 RepID=UPI002BDA25BF|nr:S-methyl-5-thioribose-1-phosphate isomerase [Actinospica sp.]HWG28196.1 S-methyl-5-thioribose-1-phosphate isomerase [Actinospica sp.]